MRKPGPLFDIPEIPSDVVIYRIHGSFFFGAASELTKVTQRVASRLRLFILDFQDVPPLDSTGAASLKGIIEDARSRGTRTEKVWSWVGIILIARDGFGLDCPIWECLSLKLSYQ
jgi:MFS superfamily sulfate permease-like transporter